MSPASTSGDNNRQARVLALPIVPTSPLAGPGEKALSTPQTGVELGSDATATIALPTQQPLEDDASEVSGATDGDASEILTSTLPVVQEPVNPDPATITHLSSDDDARSSDCEECSSDGEDVETTGSDEEDGEDSDQDGTDLDSWFTEEGSPTDSPETARAFNVLKVGLEEAAAAYPRFPFTGPLYPDIVDDQSIDAFLEDSPLYDPEQKCWIGLCSPQGGRKPSRTKVVERLARIISSIMEELAGIDGRRRVAKTDGIASQSDNLPKRMAAKAEKEKGEKERKKEAQGSEKQTESVEEDDSLPFLVIVAEGPSFGLDKKTVYLTPDGVAFTSITTRIDLVRDVEDVLRVGFDGLPFWRHMIYARQMFVQQPNRRFVRTFLLDKDKVLFLHFDRSGLYTKVIDGYHNHNVKSFVRLIVGLSSVDEETLGLDSSLQWKFDDKGMRAGATVKVTDDDTKLIHEYELDTPTCDFQGIISRSKEWRAKDPAKKGVIFRLTDTWREVEDAREASASLEFLKTLRDLDGLPQQLEYETIQGGWQTRDLHTGEYPLEKTTGPRNWVCSRRITERGGPLTEFKSELHLIRGLRDAIEGHANLYLKAQTLHRHVEPWNIFIARRDAPPGKRGFLGDVESLKPISTPVPDAIDAVDPKFVSVALLVNDYSPITNEKVLLHDYTDDLQSFFFVLCWTMHIYDGPGKKREYISRLGQLWRSSVGDLRRHRLFKQELLRGTLKNRRMFMSVGKDWTWAPRGLLQQFRSLSLELWQEKEKIRMLPNAEERHAQLLDEAKVRQTYDRVLSLFDIAIAKLSHQPPPTITASRRLSSKSPALCAAIFLSAMSSDLDSDLNQPPTSATDPGPIDLGPPQTLGEDAGWVSSATQQTAEGKLDVSKLAAPDTSKSQDVTRDSEPTTPPCAPSAEQLKFGTRGGAEAKDVTASKAVLREKDSLGSSLGEKQKDIAAADGDIVERDRNAQAELVASDLHYIYPCKAWFYDHLYQGTATKEEIDSFLERCPLYDGKKKEWVGIHPLFEVPTLERPESAIVEAMGEIITAIVEGLGACAGRRRLVKTNDVKLFHQEEGWHCSQKEFSSPTFVVAAEGPSFERPENDPDGVGFANIITCIDVVANPRVSIMDNEVVKKQAIYGRQMFIQQPNRRFIRTFTIDRQSIHFFHFDRSGIHRGIICGYHHHNIHAFIRLILGLCSLDEEVLGLDPSFQWKLDDKGRKAQGILSITDHDTMVTKKFELHAVRPMFLKRHIHGPGTVCWLVRDHESNRLLLVKDNWRSQYSSDATVTTPEYEQLKKCRKLEGVVQMILYEADHVGWETKDLGVMDYAPPDGKHPRFRRPCAQNRILSRVLTELYGQDISHFKSEKQLLCALRDAIGGHRNLYLRVRTLHRDIAWQNILLGNSGAPRGQQGVLIDLDLAKPIEELEAETHAASIFYVLASLMYHYDSRGVSRAPIPPILEEWWCYQEYTFRNCVNNLKLKRRFILSDPPTDPANEVGNTWSKASRNLLQKFYSFTRQNAIIKEEIRKCEDGERYDGLLEEDTVRQNYDRVLLMFDTAIIELDTELGEPTPTTCGLKRKASKDLAVGDVDG
ncbi:hypothetical protein MD484_g4502, partial [Candolleomyces efflorescens]